MPNLKERIQSLASQWSSSFVDIRHHLHENPELSYKEFETSAYIRDRLSEYNIEHRTMAETGVVGLIKGKDPESRTIALRADIDALPIEEANDVPYKSKKQGIMHACGHDVHTTVLLGAVRILQELRNEWSGTVKCIFQPGEERNPGGASIMIKEGVLQNPAPSGIIGLHVHPGLEKGKLSFRPGQVMASADEIYITVSGPGGHAAAPHLTTDTILIASHIIIALQQVISRNNDPFSPSVLSICSVQGGHTTNVIPSEVKLMGTFRALNEDWRFRAHTLIQRIAKQTAEAMGGKADVHIDVGYPAVYNNEKLTAVARDMAEQFIGNQNVETTEMRMGAEDFGYYSQVIPGCFYRLGVRNTSKGIVSGVHTPTFNIDESAIEIGAGVMAWLGATVIND
jgi:amidohydrolase